jgi:uncharacterized membrane protein YsdA (DUF1294 family)
MTYFLVYLALVNILAFLLMGLDKYKAKKGAWRIPERTLFLSALIGGSLGANLGMQLFRHKTKHRSFIIGMPAILIIQLLLGFLLSKSL